MRIFDCVMFRDELDMLEGRLGELSSLPGYCLVLVESEVTHRGDPKPLVFRKNAGRFAQWADRIVHVITEPVDPSLDPWPREHAQRDAAMPVLDARAADGDVVLIADLDEFPPRDFAWDHLHQAVSFNQRLAMYAVDLLFPQLHVCTVAAPWRYIRARGSLAAVRDGRYGYRTVPGGWHLTWLGGVEAQRAKLAVTCHTEMTDLSKDLLRSGRCYTEGIHHTGDFHMIPADVDETWPGFIYRRECPENWFRPRG